MGVRLNVVALLAFSALVALPGCAGSKTSGEAKGPESNPWADYKGTYATAGSGSSSSKSGAAKSAKTEVAAAEAPKSEEPAAVEEAPAPAPVAAPPAKKGKTAGKGAKKKK